MKKKIKDLTLEEIFNFKCSSKGTTKCANCPFTITYNYGCSLHDLRCSLSQALLEKEVEVDE